MPKPMSKPISMKHPVTIEIKGVRTIQIEYGRTIGDLLSELHNNNVTALYNMHNKLVPRECIIRGNMTLKTDVVSENNESN